MYSFYIYIFFGDAQPCGQEYIFLKRIFYFLVPKTFSSKTFSKSLKRNHLKIGSFSQIRSSLLLNFFLILRVYICTIKTNQVADESLLLGNAQ